ncbi:MAG: 4Fe-4S binding protein [Anaerolineae bacterium]|jgi:Pyruvate/2-oxoacid:ferredoxin oxidoreductase delta subunit
MSEPVYRSLAQTLHSLPNGFPPTETGVELRLLAKIFTPEEAALASVMRDEWEPAEAIAVRAGVEPKAAYNRLKAMARKGQIYAGRRDRKLAFRLMPFAVGIYEEQLSRIDEELALLFEEYYVQAQGAINRFEPALQRVIPVEETVSAGIEIYPYERASQMLDQAKAWGVRECICRTQQKLIGKGCDHPLEACLVFAPVEGVFEHSEVTRAISREEAHRILHEAEEAGLVHSPGNYRDGHFYICNCCTCCCAVLRSVAEFGMPPAMVSSGFVAVVDEAACAACGDCLERCQFGALAIVDDICRVDSGRCVGCGLCATVCPSGALQLERLPEATTTLPPVDLRDWKRQRAQTRGLVPD